MSGLIKKFAAGVWKEIDELILGNHKFAPRVDTGKPVDFPPGMKPDPLTEKLVKDMAAARQVDRKPKI
ncbi:MAG: hypothetical protein V1721_04050 [Pseudomonadota bacterium]